MNPLGYTTPKYLIWKILVFLGYFSIIHFIYEWLPYPPVLIIGASDESVFAHMKMAFWAYLFTAGTEYAHFRKTLTNKRGFLLSRVFSATLIPWFEVLFWYIVPAIVKAEIPLPLELAWSMIVLAVAVFLLGGLEREWQEGTFPRYTTTIIMVLFGISLFFFTAFTFEKPWIDIFYLPE